MATAKIVKLVIKEIYCDRLNRDVSLIEDRVYPPDMMPDAGPVFHRRARMCSFGVDCNRLGYACKWSGLNPNYDPFEIE